ncbi:MAG: hypothetical protein ACJAT8_001032 [Cellvibrionaceae bacterium]|jgi:hypothetical protein
MAKLNIFIILFSSLPLVEVNSIGMEILTHKKSHSNELWLTDTSESVNSKSISSF